MLWLHTTEGTRFADLGEAPTHHSAAGERPLGFGRFLFRRSILPADLAVVLPYLDAFAINLLFGTTKSLPTRRCTVVMDIQDRFNIQLSAFARPVEEREILTDYAPSVFSKTSAGVADAMSISPESLTSEQKIKFAVELAHSVPLPEFLKKIGFGFYRFWLRRHNAKETKPNI